ncbi:response regulator receiver modulated diguanylate cyclase [Marivita hallyeonensis]|uniref:diguanylate cyclase n=2 Tax=Marivita hallyeonensis TaxID=996342 RepID=A0A1M5X0W3_9RHOB|nr:response regulator receiver modulated diguanylate cyclase [Marivita hallyeonensis]
MHRVDHAERQLDGLSQIRATPPDVVIIAHDLPGLKLASFCKLLRANPKTQLTAVLVAVPTENHSARVAALSAGAADVIEYAVDASDLQARLRSFMRQQCSLRDTRTRTGIADAVGFAEDQILFEQTARVATILCTDCADLVARTTALGAGTDHRTSILSAEDARRGLPEAYDVCVIWEAGQPNTARHLLGILKSTPITRHSKILFVADSSSKLSPVSPLDIGAADEVPDCVSNEELLLRIKRLARTKRLEDEARETLKTLDRKAYTDPVTGLHNRQFANEYLQRQDRERAENPQPMALILADIDHFKKINDNHGHTCGDEVLAHIASLLKSSVRSSDMVARYGGEEFLVVLPGIGLHAAKSVADRLLNAVARDPKQISDGTHVRATISLGLAHISKASGQSTRDLFNAADKALYRAKSDGRNRLRIATVDDFFGCADRSSSSLARETMGTYRRQPPASSRKPNSMRSA